MKDLTPLQHLLGDCSTLSLATVDADELPHAANVNFVADDQLNLYWLSSPQSAHSQHLLATPRVAATAYTPFSQPAQIRGVQLHGDARPAPAEHFDTLWRSFCDKFPYAADMGERAKSEQFYQLRPHWARIIDNSVRFGFKLEWHFDRPSET